MNICREKKKKMGSFAIGMAVLEVEVRDLSVGDQALIYKRVFLNYSIKIKKKIKKRGCIQRVKVTNRLVLIYTWYYKVQACGVLQCLPHGDGARQA